VTDSIFSFGTLQLPDVQTALFGRSIPTTPDSLVGWTVGTVQIRDPEVIELSGTDIHPALIQSKDSDVVPGAVLAVTPEELAAADHYERVSYRRIKVVLVSGNPAWVYVPREQESA